MQEKAKIFRYLIAISSKTKKCSTMKNKHVTEDILLRLLGRILGRFDVVCNVKLSEISKNSTIFGKIHVWKKFSIFNRHFHTDRKS